MKGGCGAGQLLPACPQGEKKDWPGHISDNKEMLYFFRYSRNFSSKDKLKAQ